jgi:glycosyltransferase involved in cell wall biosynthesis
MHLRRVARRLGFRSPILWVFDPMLVHAVGKFAEKFVVYHVIDNYVEYRPAGAVRARQVVARNEQAMLGAADVVFAVSQTLHQRCLQRNPNSFLVPNAVDYEQFQQALTDAAVPADVQKIPKPVIGYVGHIQPSLNFPLLQRMADDHPEWSLMLVGPEELGRERSQLDALLKRPNVFYLGFKPVRDVPHYIKCCDVCIMPDDERNDGDRLKLYEYFACGRPVVTTNDDASVRRFKPLVRIAQDESDFIDGILQSLGEERALATTRMAIARDNSWATRIHAISQATNERLSFSEPSGAMHAKVPVSRTGVSL